MIYCPYDRKGFYKENIGGFLQLTTPYANYRVEKCVIYTVIVKNVLPVIPKIKSLKRLETWCISS